MNKKDSRKPVQVKSEPSYHSLLESLKQRVKEAQIKAALSVNSELMRLYWDIGRTIVQKQESEGWGAQVIEKLSQDLQKAFPGIQGFSRANIFMMRAFYLAYEKVLQAVRQFEDLPIARIPWGHNIRLLTQLKSTEERLWYAEQVVEHGLSRAALEDWIKAGTYKRQGKAITNFAQCLPQPQSHLAQEVLRDPYNFDFLTLAAGYKEKELEDGLVLHIQKFLLELGKGFAFIGRQYHIEIDSKNYYIDLLFYHTKLHCYVVVELKAREFQPEYAGKLNFYLSAIDDLLRTPLDQPTIGLLLCKTKSNFTVEYALRDINKPMGVAHYATEIVENIPGNLKSSLPTIAELESEFEIADKKNEKPSQ
jgi:predicted nuclease of restriction endonuclease-like (RecB) superfamily